MAVARVSKITAASSKSFQEATEEGLERATKTLRGVTGFEVLSLKGNIASHWRSVSFWNDALKYLQLAWLVQTPLRAEFGWCSCELRPCTISSTR